MPEHVLLLTGEVVIGLENREVIVRGTTAKLVFPLFHLFAPPALHTTIIDTECRVRNHQFLVCSDNPSESLTSRTGPQRRVEREGVVIRFREFDAVGFKSCRELIDDIGRLEHQTTSAVSFVESGLG